MSREYCLPNSFEGDIGLSSDAEAVRQAVAREKRLAAYLEKQSRELSWAKYRTAESPRYTYSPTEGRGF